MRLVKAAPKAATSPTISAQPQGLQLTYGYTAGSLSVTATAATDTTYNDLTYQWYSNTTNSTEGGTAITENGTSATYTIPIGKTAGTTEYYYCVVTATRNDNGQTATATSSVATVSVSAADPATPTNLTATYGQTLADVTLPDDWAWAVETTTSVGNAGTNTFKANYTAPNANYNSKTDVDVEVTVEKANAVAATVSANNRTYDGTEKPLVTVDNSTLMGGTMHYALGENATTAPADNLYTTSIPSKTDAGTYYVWYKAVGDANHNDSEPQKVTSTIAKKDEPAPKPQPGPTPGAVALFGSGHVQGTGDVAAKASGKGIVIGTTGQSKRLEQLTVSLPKDTNGGIEYRGHLQGIGWGEWVQGGKPCGTTGESRRMEAVQMRLTGALAWTHSVWYRVHSQTWGTLGWARDGQAAGTAGQSKRAEAIEVQVLPQGEVPEGYVEREASYVGAVSANVHLQGTGWTGASSALEFGTTGQSRRLEAVRISGPATPVSAGISYEVHAQGFGWMPAKSDGALAGTTGQSRRLEAVRVRLTGEAAKDGNYSVWYRVHSQNYGWLGWTCDGEPAGTTGLSKRAEAIDVQVLPQGQVPRGYDASKAACVNG
ncbi:MAG: hypothetical protein Q4A01_11920 [Coriobacteriales bacterium]|nr:hypothetical protein [Coriobacteriales bacterium]